MEQRIDELLSEGKEVPYVFDDDDEIDKKERSIIENSLQKEEVMCDSILEKKYIEQGAKQCPFCNSNDLSSNGYDFKDYVTVIAIVNCEACKRSWLETYTLSTIEFNEL